MRARIITPKKANRLSRARQANGNASRRLKRTRNGSAPTMPPVTHYFGQRHNTAGIFWTTTKIGASWGALRQKCHHDSHEHQDGRAGEREGASRLRMGSARAALMAEHDVPLVM
jgi:hypothetical protein